MHGVMWRSPCETGSRAWRAAEEQIFQGHLAERYRLRVLHSRVPNTLNERLRCDLLYLDGKVAVLTIMLGALIDALAVRVSPDYDFDKFAAELMDKIPKGYTEHRAAFNDGRREGLRELSRIMSERSKRGVHSSLGDQE